MIELIKAPTKQEAIDFNHELEIKSKESFNEFIDAVLQKINDTIVAQNWIHKTSTTCEIRWDWLIDKFPNILQKHLYDTLLPIFKQKIDDAGYGLFYSGGGDRVYYFTLTPKELKDKK